MNIVIKPENINSRRSPCGEGVAAHGLHVWHRTGHCPGLGSSRPAVAMNWCWNYVTFQRGTRLITGISGSRIEDVMPVLSTAPALAVSAGDSGFVETVQTLQHDELARQKGPQHV